MKEFTVKEIADLLEVSKPTVQKAITEASIDPVRIEKNKYRMYSYADTVAIIKAVKSDFDFSVIAKFGGKSQSETAKPQDNSQISQNETEEPQNQTEKSQNTAKSEELELMRSMLSLIQEQMKEKDKQLAIKDKQIQDLSDRLAEAMHLTKGQQYIAAADKTVQLMDRGKAEDQDIVFAEEPDQESTETSTEEEECPAATIGSSSSAADPIQEEPQKVGFFKRLFRKLGE